MTEAEIEEFRQDFADNVRLLVTPERPKITAITNVASEAFDIKFGDTVVDVLMKRLKEAPPQHVLPALYLIDSILKNTKGKYIALLSAAIVPAFLRGFSNASPTDQPRFVRTIPTWKGYFSDEILNDMKSAMARLAHRKRPAPVTTVPPGGGGVGYQQTQPRPPKRMNSMPTDINEMARLVASENNQVSLQVDRQITSLRMEMSQQRGQATPNQLKQVQTLIALQRRYPLQQPRQQRQQRAPVPVPVPIVSNTPALDSNGMAALANLLSAGVIGQQKQQKRNQRERRGGRYKPPPSQSSRPRQSQYSDRSGQPKRARTSSSSHRSSGVQQIDPLKFGNLMRKNSRAIDTIYRHAGKPCPTCARRIDDPEAFQRHLDRHFKDKQRATKHTQSRMWFLGVTDWEQELGGEQQEEEKEEIEAAAVKTAAIKEINNVVVDASQPLCTMCQEAFEKVWHNASGQWRVKEAEMRGTIIFHSQCLSGTPDEFITRAISEALASRNKL